MKKVYGLICIMFIIALIGCQPKPLDDIDPNLNASIVIHNDGAIYYDELIDGELKVDTSINDSKDTELIYLVDQVSDFVEVIDNKIMIKNTVPKNYLFTLTVVLSKKRSIYTTKDFVVNYSRGVIMGDNQISQVVVTVNGDTTSSRGISWFTSKNIEDSVVYISKSNTFINSRKITGERKVFTTYAEASDKAKHIAPVEFYNHQALITNLEPNTTYYYKVGSDILNLYSKIGSFKTASDTGEVKIFLTTDVHVGANEKASPNTKFYHSALSDAVLKHGKINYALNTGDLVTQWASGYHRFESEWAYAMNISPLLRDLTFIPLAGNHDSKFTNTDFDNSFNNHYSLPAANDLINDNHKKGPNYSFDLYDVHIVMLNYHENNMLTDTQTEWLLKDLSTSTKPWKIVFSHIALPSDVKSILESQNVTLAFSGHEHIYRRSYPTLSSVKQEMIFDETSNLLVNQKGTMYVVNSTTGGADTWKNYTKNPLDIIGFGVGDTLENLGRVETRWGMYSVLTILKNEIKVDVYVRNSTNANDEFKLFESYGFKKQ